MAMNAEVAAIDQGFTQKMGRCQTRSDALQVSEFRFDPVYLHRGGQWKRTERRDTMSAFQMPMWQQWAHFRFSVIGGLLSCPPQKGQLQKAIGRLAQKTYRHPIDSNRQIQIGSSTIERW